MSAWLQVAESRWPWITPVALVALELARRASSRRRAPHEPARAEWTDSEQILFPSGRPGRGLARLLSSPARLALKEAGQDALKEEIQRLKEEVGGLKQDWERSQADNRRLRAELASLAGSSDGSTAMRGMKSPRLRPRRPRSEKSGGSAKP